MSVFKFIGGAQTISCDSHESVLKSWSQNGFMSSRKRRLDPIDYMNIEMSICSATCKDGSACHFKALSGSTACGKHTTQGSAVIVYLCGHRMGNGNLCTNNRGDGLNHCVRHHRLIREHAERRAAKAVLDHALEMLWRHNDDEGARSHIVDAFAADEISERFFVMLINTLDEDIAFHRNHLVPVLPVMPLGELHALSLDTQSVHTAPVNKQTQEGLDLLLDTHVEPSDICTITGIASSWDNKSPKAIASVVKDMRTWYKTKTCRTKNDYLYKRALDGLWSRIQLSPAKDDLLQRLWEECYESLKMCCEGHISRLCNVMCGFDDEFKAPVSIGEMLQQKMSAIAEMDIDVHHKVGEAWVVFEELAVPMEERMSWLEAF